MGTSGSRNPTQTLQALAWRTADHRGRALENDRGLSLSDTMLRGKRAACRHPIEAVRDGTRGEEAMMTKAHRIVGATLAVAVAVAAGVVSVSSELQSRQGASAKPTVTKEQYYRWVKEQNNWGRWGKEDEIGTINLITPAHVARASQLVRDGGSHRVPLLRVSTGSCPDHRSRPRDSHPLFFPLRHDARDPPGRYALPSRAARTIE